MPSLVLVRDRTLQLRATMTGSEFITQSWIHTREVRDSRELSRAVWGKYSTRSRKEHGVGRRARPTQHTTWTLRIGLEIPKSFQV